MGPLDFIGPVSDLTRDVLDKIWPSPEDKAKVEQARAQIHLALAKQASDEDGAFRQFVVQYEGEGDKVAASLQWYRGSVRPTITYGLVALFGWGFCHPGEFTQERMQMLWQLNLISLGFWYGEKALAGLNLDLGKVFAPRAQAVDKPLPKDR